jgi:hypothetical protein
MDALIAHTETGTCASVHTLQYREAQAEVLADRHERVLQAAKRRRFLEISWRKIARYLRTLISAPLGFLCAHALTCRHIFEHKYMPICNRGR